MKRRDNMATFALDDWNYDDSNLDKYILNGWKGSSTETEIYIPGEYNGRQISLKNLKIFPTSMTKLQLEELNSKKVQLETTDLSGAFENNSTVINLDLSGLDTSQVINMNSMFLNCKGLTSLDLSQFQTENVTDMGSMFNSCSSLTNLDVSHFKTESVTNMNGMFANCYQLTSLDISQFQTQSVTDMYCMFASCIGLTSLDISQFQTQSVTDMYCMFASCIGLTSLDVSQFQTENVTNMNAMFNGCSELMSLDMSQFQTENVTQRDAVFGNCNKLKIIDLSQCHWDNIPLSMFSGIQSNVPFIVISPADGIKNYDFSNLRPLSTMHLTANKGSFSNQTNEKTEHLDRYVYESRETFEAAIRDLQDNNHPFYPTYYFLRWDLETLIPVDSLEGLWNQANGIYTAVWWPSEVKLRSRLYL